MGSFAYYTGCMTIPEEKKPVFVEQMCRLLYLGGMMTTEEVKMFGNTLTLLKPVLPIPKGVCRCDRTDASDCRGRRHPEGRGGHQVPQKSRIREQKRDR